MANRIEAALGGVDTLKAVFLAWDDELGPDASEHAMLRDAAQALTSLMLSDHSRRAALAIACAVLNQSFALTGNLYRVNDKGQIGHEYISQSGVRDMIMSLMAG